jgi:hypothetical protein
VEKDKEIPEDQERCTAYIIEKSIEKIGCCAKNIKSTQ